MHDMIADVHMTTINPTQYGSHHHHQSP